jgi:hypothetical protein
VVGSIEYEDVLLIDLDGEPVRGFTEFGVGVGNAVDVEFVVGDDGGCDGDDDGVEEFLFKADDGEKVNVELGFIIVAGVGDDDELNVVDVEFIVRDDGGCDGDDDGVEEFLFKADDGEKVNVALAFIIVAGVCDDDELNVVDVEFIVRDDGGCDGDDDGVEEFLFKVDDGKVNVALAFIIVAGVGDDDELNVVDVEFIV